MVVAAAADTREASDQ